MLFLYISIKYNTMNRFKVTLFIALFLSISLMSQNKENEVVEITKTVQNYYDGYIYRDLSKLNKAFDTVHGTMKVPIKQDNKITGYKNVYFKDILPIWGNRKKLENSILENCALTILNIDIVDATIASSKISMKVDDNTYIDILSLEKINNSWKITNKIYVSRK